MAAEPERSPITRRTEAGTEIQGDGARGITESTLLALAEGAGNFDVRHIRLAARGVSPDHSHPYEQANYVLAGSGRIAIDGKDHELTPGQFVFVPGNARHSVRNEGDAELLMLCVRGPQQG